MHWLKRLCNSEYGDIPEQYRAFGTAFVVMFAVTYAVAFIATLHFIFLGLGLFCCWGILFGTYRPLTTVMPPISLVDTPRLAKNPLRLLVAGPAQLAYEWVRNKSWRTRARIIFGTVDYVPPISRDFALHRDLEEGGAGNSTHVLVSVTGRLA